MMMHTLAAMAFLLGGAAVEENPEAAKLASFFQRYLEEEFERHPLDATRLGEHKYDHLLDDVSPEARRKWRTETERTLNALRKEINPARLPRNAQIDFEILEHQLEYGLWQLDHGRRYETDPRVYNELVTDCTFLLLTQSTRPKTENIRNTLSRMEQIPQVLAAAKASLQSVPKIFAETAIRQNRGAIAYYERGIFEIAGETPQLSELRTGTTKVVTALKDYQEFLEKELLPSSNGEWRLGREKFSQKLSLELDAGLTADEVLAKAEAEFERVQREMYVVSRQLWSREFPGEPLPPDDREGRRKTIQRVVKSVGRQHGSVETLVTDARGTVDRVKKFIRDKHILSLPEPDRCQIIEMPEFQRGTALAYLNPAPPLDPSAASIYAVAPPPKDWSEDQVRSFLEEYNQHMLQILTIHEAYPGHYVQLEYSNRHPSIIRRVLSSGIFAEGWAVYTEQTMLDQGYGDGDLGLRLNQLKFYLRAVANAILDHKMHCTQIDDDEALRFLTEEAFQGEGEAKLKLVRAKLTSCQLSTYFVGRTAFYTLRQSVQRKEGKEFKLGKFHERVLSHGTLPVKYLPELLGVAGTGAK